MKKTMQDGIWTHLADLNEMSWMAVEVLDPNSLLQNFLLLWGDGALFRLPGETNNLTNSYKMSLLVALL
jgi:hypothetical protein